MMLYAIYMNDKGKQCAVDQERNMPEHIITIAKLGVGQGAEVYPLDTKEASKEEEKEGENKECELTTKGEVIMSQCNEEA